MKTEIPLFKPFRFNDCCARAYKVVSLYDTAPPDAPLCTTPEEAVAYWRTYFATRPEYDPEIEHSIVLMLNTRRRIKGHGLLGVGSHDCVSIHPIQFFRLAIVTSSPAVVMMHSHPSGDPSPSESDITMTRQLRQSAALLKIDFLDHVIVSGNCERHFSLRQFGYFMQ